MSNTIKRILLASALIMATTPAVAQTVKQSRADGNRYQAVVPVTTTGPSYPTTDGTLSEAHAVVLLTPAGTPYSAGAGSAASPTYIGGQNGTSVASASNPVPVAQTTGTANEQQGSGTLAAGGTLALTNIDFGATSTPYTSVNVTVTSPTAGTLQPYYSTDNATGRLLDSRAIAANTPTTISYPIFARYFFTTFVNGAAAQGSPTYLAVSTSLGK